MAHTLKPGIKAKKRRKQSHAGSPKLKETSIALDDTKYRFVTLPNGNTTTIRAMSDDQFRDWFYGLIERVVKTLKPNDTLAKEIIDRVQKESCGLPLDEVSRWYLVDKLNGTKAFQWSGIEIFARQEVVA